MCSKRWRGRSATRRRRGSSSSTSTSIRRLGRSHHDRFQAAAAGAQEPAVQRLQVHRPGRRQLKVSPRNGGWTSTHPVLSQAPAVVAFEVVRYRHRHSGGKAEDDLRSVPAGRRQHQPQIWRHRAWALPSAANCPTCWAAKSSCAARLASAAPSRSTCRCAMSASPHPAREQFRTERRCRLSARRSCCRNGRSSRSRTIATRSQPAIQCC